MRMIGKDDLVRTLFLLRHAKSSWDDPELGDAARPLAPRGRKAARRMADYIRAHDVHPELVLCSSARRTRETLDALIPTLGPDVDVRIEGGLYAADDRELLSRLRRVGAPIESVLVVGHNPGLQDLATMLAGDGTSQQLQQITTKFPTGALATLDLGKTTWARLSPGCAYLAALVLPRELDG